MHNTIYENADRERNVNMTRDFHARRELDTITDNDDYEDQTESSVENVLGSVHISKPSIQHVFFLLKPILNPVLRQVQKLQTDLDELVNAMKLERAFIDKPVSISQNVPYVVDYRNRKFLYIMTANASSPALVVNGTTLTGMTAGKWYSLNFPTGTQIYVSGISDASPVPFTVRSCDFPLPLDLIALAPGGSVMLAPGTNNIGAVALELAGNSQAESSNFFWANVAVLAGGVSASTSITGYGKLRIFVQSSVADTFNVQFSNDGGTTWYTLTQDNAGTPLIIATTASQLTSCRDIATFGGRIRLLSVGAATVTAGFEAETV